MLQAPKPVYQTGSRTEWMRQEDIDQLMGHMRDQQKVWPAIHRAPVDWQAVW